MEMTMNIKNLSSSAKAVASSLSQTSSRILERARQASASMQHKLAVANRTVAEISEEKEFVSRQLVDARMQLERARKTIAELEQKVKSISSSVAESLAKSSKKDKKPDYGYGKKTVDAVPGEVKISVSSAN